MRSHLGRLVTAIAIVAATSAMVAAPAVAVGPGTFTKITQPTGAALFHFDGSGTASNILTVSGTTSPDVTSVDIDCVFESTAGSVTATSYASDVPVTDGAFTTIATVPNFAAPCRLRAIPVGASLDYLASFAGPLLYSYATGQVKSDGVVYAAIAGDEQATGIALEEDAGSCGVAVIATLVLPTVQAAGTASQVCDFGLPAENVRSSSTVSSASAIQVDGSNAYLPAGVQSFLIGDQSLPVTQSRLTVTFVKTATSLTMTESAPLMRCSVGNDYPPTLASCPKLVTTGVTFSRVSTMFRDMHQVRIRDSFVSTDGAAHSLHLQYSGGGDTMPTPSGEPGYTFPGHAAGFAAVAAGAVFTGFGEHAGTLLVRSDRDSVEGDFQAGTDGLSWSRPPSNVTFENGSDLAFGMAYSATVPKHGAADLGFAVSQGVLTTATKSLDDSAIAEMVNPPSITSPHNGATVHGKATTVKGEVTTGANGLPTAVTVNGHKASLSTVKGGEKFTARFKESYGKHVITVTVVDSAGNSVKKKIKIHNKR